MKLPHYEREDKPVMVCCSSSRARGLAIGLHTNTGNDGAQFDEACTGLDHVGFHVGSREELDAWIVWLELGMSTLPQNRGDEPFLRDSGFPRPRQHSARTHGVLTVKRRNRCWPSAAPIWRSRSRARPRCSGRRRGRRIRGAGNRAGRLIRRQP